MEPTSSGISHLGFGPQHEARLYRLLVKELPEYAIFFVNPDGRTASWNSGVEQILGYSETEFLDQPFSILFTEEDQRAGMPQRELINALENGSASDDRWLLRKDGQRIFASGRLIACSNESGELIGYAKIVRDQTLRKQAEQRLSEIHREQRKFARALDLTHTIIRDLDGTIRVWTRGAQELYGWTADEAAGAISYQLLNAEFPEPLEQIQEKLRRSGSWEGTLKHRSKYGRDIFVASYWVLHSGDGDDPMHTAVIEVNNDVTARKNAEVALRESEERFRKVFEESPVGKAFVRPDAERYVRINPAFARMLGYGQEELAQVAIADITYPGDREVGLTDAQRVFRGELPSAHFEKRYVAKSGAVLWGNVHQVLIRGARGEPLYNLAVIEDITRRKQIEQELRRSNEELSQFSYTAAHDLQAPLRNIGTFAQLLARRYAGQLDETAGEFIDEIVGGTERMQNLISVLLNYAQHAEEPAEKELVPVSTALETVLANLKPQIESAEAQILWEALPTVEANAFQLVHLFQNLIENALKYRGRERPRIEVAARKQSDQWLFSVSDNGVGIPPEQRNRIFAPLKRLHGQEIPGSGMGLAICKRIVERAGGSIWVESKIGQGSTFYFTLPAI